VDAPHCASGARITVVTTEGLVLADSQSDPKTMENHAGRPELWQALAEGSAALSAQRDDQSRLALLRGAANISFWKALHSALRISGGSGWTGFMAVAPGFMVRIGSDLLIAGIAVCWFRAISRTVSSGLRRFRSAWQKEIPRAGVGRHRRRP